MSGTLKRISFEVELKKIQNKLKRIPNINNGGCGFVAYYLYSRLTSLGYECNIVMVGYNNTYTDGYNNKPKRMSEFDDFRHAMVEVYINEQYLTIDADTILKGDRYNYNNIHNNACIPVTLLKMLGNPNYWNRMFKRQYAADIKAIISEFSLCATTVSESQQKQPHWKDGLSKVLSFLKKLL